MLGAQAAVVRTAVLHRRVVALRHFRRLDQYFAATPVVVHVVGDAHAHDLAFDRAEAGRADRDGDVVETVWPRVAMPTAYSNSSKARCGCTTIGPMGTQTGKSNARTSEGATKRTSRFTPERSPGVPIERRNSIGAECVHRTMRAPVGSGLRWVPGGSSGADRLRRWSLVFSLYTLRRLTYPGQRWSPGVASARSHADGPRI